MTCFVHAQTIAAAQNPVACATIKNDSCIILATFKNDSSCTFATVKKYSNGSLLAPSEAGNSRHVLGLLRGATKGVK